MSPARCWTHPSLLPASEQQSTAMRAVMTCLCLARVMEMPQHQPGQLTGGILGCSKCRFASKGCRQCRNPAFKGRRGAKPIRDGLAQPLPKEPAEHPRAKRRKLASHQPHGSQAAASRPEPSADASASARDEAGQSGICSRFFADPKTQRVSELHTVTRTTPRVSQSRMQAASEACKAVPATSAQQPVVSELCATAAACGAAACSQSAGSGSELSGFQAQLAERILHNKTSPRKLLPSSNREAGTADTRRLRKRLKVCLLLLLPPLMHQAASADLSLCALLELHPKAGLA